MSFNFRIRRGYETTYVIGFVSIRQKQIFDMEPASLKRNSMKISNIMTKK